MRSVGRFLLTATVVVFIGLVARAEEAAKKEKAVPSATIDAETMRFDQPSATYMADGKVVIRYKGDTLHADHVKFNKDTKDAWAEGNVHLNQPGQEWVGPTMYYNFDTHALKIDHVRGFMNPLYLEGDHLESAGTNHYNFTRDTIRRATTTRRSTTWKRRTARSGPAIPRRALRRYAAVWEYAVFWLPHRGLVLKGGPTPDGVQCR